MAATTAASVALLLVLLPASLGWTDCPPPSPGPGHGGRPGKPPSGSGGGHGHGHHSKPPKHHHNPPSTECPPCHPPPYAPPTPLPPPYVPPSPPYFPPPTPPYVPPTPPYVPPSPPYVPPTPPTPPYVPPTPPYVPPYVPPTPPYVPTPPSPSPGTKTCPIDALKLNACVDVLGGLVHLVIGREARSRCCPLVQGVADLDAAVCLCTTIRARLLNIDLYLPVALELLVTCGKRPPPGFHCPPLHA